MSAQTPIVKRTRRHVVLRLTPDQARAFALLAHGLEIPARQHNRLRKMAQQAGELAGTSPEPCPRPTSIKAGEGLRLRAGRNQMRKGAET